MKQTIKSLIKIFGFGIHRLPLDITETFKESINLNLVAGHGGVLHLGAHEGQEAQIYNKIGASVIWIEAIPEKFEVLKKRIEKYPNQRAVQAILGDKNNSEIKFNISSDEGVSSSIYPLSGKYPEESFVMSKSFTGKMFRLDYLFSLEEITKYPHWVVDLQGAELLALQGAGNLLKLCKSMQVEVSTREIYLKGVLWKELFSFLSSNGFIQLWEPKRNSHENVIFVRA